MRLKFSLLLSAVVFSLCFGQRAIAEDIMEDMLTLALTDLADSTAFPNIEKLPSGTRIVSKGRANYNIYYCILTNHANQRFFLGYADFTDPKDPALLWGKIGDMAGKEPKVYPVCFDATSTMQDLRPMGTLKGTYYFGEGFLKWNGTRDKSRAEFWPNESDYYRQYTTSGTVGETTSGFYPETLETSDVIKFNGAGRGSGIQRAEAEGREQYIGSEQIRGPRGGYRGTNNNDQGYVTYHVKIERVQPMTYSFDPKTKELNLKFSQSQTPSIKYLKATNHPVMTEIKQSYAKWPSKAPLRFKYDEKFIVVAILPDWLVVRRPDDPDTSALSYWLIPRDGYIITVKNPQFQWETMDIQASPANFGRIVENYINTVKNNWNKD